MNDAALRTFLAINETGSLVRASERLNVTQSTITARLKTLEAELGQPLFTRSKSGAHLTAAGARFLRYAEAMNALWGQARQDIGLPKEVDGVCNIACVPPLWDGYGALAAKLIRKASAAVAAWPCEEGQIEEWLSSGLADFALTHRPSALDNVTSRHLGDEAIRLYSTDPDSPIRFDPTYIFVDNGEAFGRAHHAAYADADTASLSFGSPVWALDHLMRNGGSAYLPASLAAKAGDALYVKPDAPAFSRAIYLITADRAAADWPWLEEVANALTAQAAPR